MMALTSAEPALYAVADNGTPTLFAARDAAGNVSFPYQTYGSPSTGDHGDDVARIELSGNGIVAATATVFHHPGGTLDTPYVVASIVLDEGPMIRAVLAASASKARRGDKVRAVTEPVTVQDSETYELRFETTAAQEHS